MRDRFEILPLGGDLDEAERELLSLGEEAGWSSVLFGGVIALYEDRGDFEQALVWIGHQEQQIGVTVDSLIARGRNEMARGRYDEARVSFESALEREPRNTAAQEALEQVTSMMP